MDTESLLRSLNAHRVRYVVIGASAFPIHGYVRATLDVDIFIEPSRGNAERVHEALSEFGYDMNDVHIDDLLTKKLLIRQCIVETDVHPFVAGVSFEEVWETRVEGCYGATEAPFAGLQTLIKMKKAAGRPKDVEDLRYLERLQGGAEVHGAGQLPSFPESDQHEQ